MRIVCPYCGQRDTEEFSIKGEVPPARPAPSDYTLEDIKAFHNYVHLRANDFGLTREYWYHAQGCRRWLIVSRDTRNHAVLEVALTARAAR